MTEPRYLALASEGDHMALTAYEALECMLKGEIQGQYQGNEVDQGIWICDGDSLKDWMYSTTQAETYDDLEDLRTTLDHPSNQWVRWCSGMDFEVEEYRIFDDRNLEQLGDAADSTFWVIKMDVHNPETGD